MPTVSVANFENEELLSTRLLSFVTNNEHSSVTFDSLSGNNSTNGLVSSGTFTPSYSIPLDTDYNCANLRTLCRNGSTPTMNMSHDRTLEAASTPATKEPLLSHSSSTGLVSGSCTPPPTFIPSTIGSYIQRGAPSHSAITSPCLGNKLSANVASILNYNIDRHSLQNSPFYSHYSLTGTASGNMNRHFNGVSPSNIGSMLANGGNLPTNSRNGFCQEPIFAGSSSRASSSGCPQRELFPTLSSTHPGNNQNVFGSGLHVQDRLYYHALATKYGFIVGSELDRVKDNSCRSTSQSYGRIAAHFRNRYGETEAKTKAAYLQIGVRVPSKDHVSEIVGKGGQKIKLIREETGALITTPGEHEEHVFIIEAPPEIAMRVAHHLTTRAHEITQSKLAVSERRRGSTSSQQQQQSITSVDSTFNSGIANGGSICTLNGGATSSTASATAGLFSSRGGLLSMTGLNASAQNSPLHPSAGSVFTVASPQPPTTPSGQQHQRSTGTTPAAGTIFQGSIPSSSNGFPSAGGVLAPGSSPVSCLFGSTGGCTNNAVGSPATTGSRILLARGRISVPQEMVGKIIGTQGSIITTIQKDTGTEIKSPPKEAARGPNATSEFEISAYQGLGLNSNQAAEYRVQQAKQLIGHLVMRQLERRASEEVEEVWNTGCSTTAGTTVTEDSVPPPVRAHTSNGGGCGGGGGSSTSGSNGSTPRISNAGWMWPDVVQMDSQEAREVLDRILAESKNKTRRAKEIAAASASQSPPSSISVMSPHGSTGVSGSSSIDHHHHHSQQQQQLRHLLSSTNLFTTGGGCAIDASDLINESQVTVGRSPSSAAAVAAAAVFNGHRHQYALGGGAGSGILERLHSAPHSSASAAVSMAARTVSSNHSSIPTGDSLRVFNRSPGSQVPCDPWSSEISPHHLTAGSASINPSHFNLSHSAAPPGLEATRKNTDFCKPSFFDFNHTNSQTSGSFGSTTGDLSSGSFLLHHHVPTHQQLLSSPSDLFQQLNKRRSDWVNSGTSDVQQQHNFSELCRSSGSPIVTTIDTASSSHFATSSTVAPASEEKEKALPGDSIFTAPSYDIIKALDQLYISQAGEEQTMVLDRESTGPPPGFELQHQQHHKTTDESNDSGTIFSSFSKLPNEEEQLLLFGHQHELTASSSSHPWCSNTGNMNGDIINNNNNGDGDNSLSAHQSSFSTSILLRSIFSNGGSGCGGGVDGDTFADAVITCCSVAASSAPTLMSTAAAAAIWSQSAATADSDNKDQKAEESRSVGAVTCSSSLLLSEDHSGAGMVGVSRGGCGAIGEGRRRHRRDENSDSSSTGTGDGEQQPTQLDQQVRPVVPLSTATEVV